ncbi:MAG: antibiotic biosynthesis monooxygenase [Saprospiraceae bacterium]|nr:antibiotic biosynthesis monooxygenase [Saprospiraceae bacterium]
MIRLVKLTVKPDQIQTFKEIFHSNSKVIARQAGCSILELWQDQENPQIFYTYSQWQSADCLESYRASPFFGALWIKVKPLFEQGAQVWNLNHVPSESHP